MIYKETYRGRAIYWHGEHGYGSETDAVAPTLRECRERIDALEAEDVAARLAKRSAADVYWDSLPHETRAALRRAYNASTKAQAAFESVADYALANK